MALERIPADIRADGGVARMSDPAMIKAIMAAVTIPVMAKARIGHQVCSSLTTLRPSLVTTLRPSLANRLPAPVARCLAYLPAVPREASATARVFSLL